jgi:ATP-dependent DNA helicase RecG
LNGDAFPKSGENDGKVAENVTDASQKTSQKTSQKIIDLIKEDPYISTSKMAEIIGVDRRNIARNIKKLQLFVVSVPTKVVFGK